MITVFSKVLYRFRVWRNDKNTKAFNEECWKIECEEHRQETS